MLVGREAFPVGSRQFIKGELLNFRWVILQVQVVCVCVSGFPTCFLPFVWETAHDLPPNMFLDFFCTFRTYTRVARPETNIAPETRPFQKEN